MVSYQIKSGDTLAKIAYKNKVRIEDLVSMNRDICSKDDYLQPGQWLHIPEKPILSLYQEFSCHFEYGWRELDRDMKALDPLISKEQIGTSRMGKPIWLLKVGEGKKRIFFSGTWHGNEWLNTWLLMTFLQQLSKKVQLEEKWFGTDVERMLEEATLYFVPLVNPDGAELVQEGLIGGQVPTKECKKINEQFVSYHHWSANAAGVDLNHQWPAGWKEEALTSPNRPFFRHFGGEAPLTEPEARAIYELTMREEFSHVLAFHSQGEEIYWGYRNQEPSESQELVHRLARASSYRPVKTADSKAGYKDWFIKEFRRPGFTIETGIGQNPLPMSASARIWLTAVPLLLESCTFPDFS